MKLPLWAQVQVERFLDELKEGSVTIQFDGTAVRKVKVEVFHKEPKDQRLGHLEF